MNTTTLNTSLERLQEIENERAKTNNDPKFQEWRKQLNVSRLYSQRDGIDKANDMMKQWNKECSYF